eukprot:CAMPEP_0172445988 /NCGR_PEP_ID=MMETSP1065-20121228/5708_1 /TAXON_ID=265537 /ORGANISM="Amphiprora paludosa, Strain CCMP125" /LENGTH=585 /DNA_ID=CAMNT_0013197003 /DNA_START=143 /DNA_END=1900 /DNA_ORIENTATION=-
MSEPSPASPANGSKHYGSITIRHDNCTSSAPQPNVSQTSSLPQDNGVTAVPLKSVTQEMHQQAQAEGKSYSSSSSYSREHRVLIKTQSSFWEDAAYFRGGSVPHSIILATVIGIVCGSSAFVYYAALEYMLDLLWEDLPELIFVNTGVSESLYWLWIPILGFSLAACVGITVIVMGEPGDLPYTIKCVHEKAYVAMDHVMPMVGASFFSILGGGSLGPEAPLVAICAAIGGFISRTIFGCTDRNLIRKHTLMGMAGALAAFFGCPIGGSLFALEVNSRFGVEYFEHSIEAIFSGEVCLAVFRTLARLPIKYIWTMPGVAKLDGAETIQILYGTCIGLFGALVAWAFARFHATVMGFFARNNLLENHRAVHRALAGSIVIVILGTLVPQTMFWGEYEFQTVWTMSPASTLEHIWPTTGATGFEMNSFWTAVIVGVAKLVAISFTVAGGYRGGYIFPVFCSGAAFGRAIFCLFPFIPVQLCTLCMAAAMNVALTRTSLATTLILSYLSAEQASLSSILAASLTSLFATAYMPFIKSQVDRADLDAALYFHFDSSSSDDEVTVDGEKQQGKVDENDEVASEDKPLLIV